MPFCTSCGSEIQIGDQSCPKCGSPVGSIVGGPVASLAASPVGSVTGGNQVVIQRVWEYDNRGKAGTFHTPVTFVMADDKLIINSRPELVSPGSRIVMDSFSIGIPYGDIQKISFSRWHHFFGGVKHDPFGWGLEIEYHLQLEWVQHVKPHFLNRSGLEKITSSFGLGVPQYESLRQNLLSKATLRAQVSLP
jgi:zinc ribbon protein